MKLLILTQDITVKEVPQTYNTGFSLMVAQIASALADEGAEVYVSSSSLKNETIAIRSGNGEKQFTLLERKLRLLFTHLRWKDVLRAFRHAFSSQKMPLVWRMKLLKYTISTGFNIHLIRQTDPDVVFIHSFGPEVFPFVSAALHTGKPFVLALHGLFSQIGKGDFRTRCEVSLLPKLLQAGMPLTVVSSGIRAKLLELYGWKECENIYVVPNALNEEGRTHDWSAEASPWTREHRIVAIGNLCERKNQLQLLQAFALLPLQLREKSELCLIGKDCLDGQLQREAERLGIARACTFTGTLPHCETFRWIKDAGVMVLASKSEGFGLSIIEGYCCGVPAVCFDHIDAFEDLYHEKCMLPVHGQSNEAFAYAIAQALTQPWDKDFIRTFAKQFNNHAMASAYMDVLRQASAGALSEKSFNGWVDEYLS